MKTIGVIGAMDCEISMVRNNMEVISAKQIIGVDFYMGKMAGNSVVVVRSRIGKVNAAICTQILIDMYGVDYVINTGVAGAISKELDVGDIVISSDLIHHDFDTSPVGDPPGINTSMPENYFKADEELIKIAKNTCEQLNDINVFIGRIASGDQFVADGAIKQKIWSNFKAICVEMEGAAIGHTCYLNKLPFVVIRSISDKANSSSNVDFDKFKKSAAENSSKVVEEMIKQL